MIVSDTLATLTALTRQLPVQNALLAAVMIAAGLPFLRSEFVFADAGIRRGDRVLIWGVNRPEYGIAFLAALHAGAVLVPLDVNSLGDFARRIARLESFANLSPVYRVNGRYSFETTKLFDERLVDRDPGSRRDRARQLRGVDVAVPRVRRRRSGRAGAAVLVV